MVHLSPKQPDGPPRPSVWRLAGGRTLPLDRARLMAVLNVTPDSFSDGGRLDSPQRVAEGASVAIDEGADALDVGGESTRPGATRIPEQEQIRRVVPAIEAIRGAGITAPISVDTTRAGVARAALDAGADAVNDVSGGREDPALLDAVATTGAGLVLMHRLRAPDEDRYSHQYAAADAPVYERGVVEEVASALADLLHEALDAGVAPECIVLDAGLGFGKSVEQNFNLVAATARFAALGQPLLCGASRKSFLGKTTGVETPDQRVAESIAASVAQRLGGGNIFRIHDVGPHRRALRIADAILDAAASEG